jgi:hypothetical protein
MVRTLAMMICAGLMCLALAACGDEGSGTGADIIQPPRDQAPPPDRVPSTGQPPQGGVDVEQSPPPSGP